MKKNPGKKMTCEICTEKYMKTRQWPNVRFCSVECMRLKMGTVLLPGPRKRKP